MRSAEPILDTLGGPRRPTRGTALSRRAGWLAAVTAVSAVAAVASQAQPDAGRIAALGRLEPKGGVIRVSGPSLPVVVIDELRVAEGDHVEKGQLLAVLDGHRRAEAEVARTRAELQRAQREAARSDTLARSAAASAAKREDAQSAVKVARAQLRVTEADLERALVRAPVDGQILEIHAHAGERLGPEGILEVGDTAAMVAVAEVYETDIGRVKPGQRATITSPALDAPLHGTVEKIGLKIGKQDVLGTDPVATADARVVEVEVLLEEGPDVSALTWLQVRVEIEP